MPYPKTEFIDESGTTLGQEEELLPITLFIGMNFDFAGKGTYQVTTWHYHYGDPNAAKLRIMLKPV